ncbi:MAG: hypothetical protein ABIX12_16135, partial [Rubrivivax sp.]
MMTHGRAVLLMIAVTLMWSIAGVVTRQLDVAQGYEVTFWRSAFNAVALVLLLAVGRGPRALVASLRREGRTILLTTHDLGDVEHLADRVAILVKGRIVADAPPDELRTGGETAIRFRLHAPPSPEALTKLVARLAQRDRGVALRPDPR